MAVDWLGDGRRAVQALPVEVEGSAPLPAGAMMLIDEHGNIEGSKHVARRAQRRRSDRSSTTADSGNSDDEAEPPPAENGD